MTSAIVLTLSVAMGSTSGLFHRDGTHRHRLFSPAGKTLPPGPGNGWGFPNNNPDGYGWMDHGDSLPLGADRTAEYFFPRYFAVPPQQIFLPQYYNPYANRGERYIPHANCGGEHPMGGPPRASAMTPIHPYNETISGSPRVAVPPLRGRVEAPPINAGGSGLIP